MTENQLKYLSYQEQARHNAATEALERDALGLREKQHNAQVMHNAIGTVQQGRDYQLRRAESQLKQQESAVKMVKTIFGFV